MNVFNGIKPSSRPNLVTVLLILNGFLIAMMLALAKTATSLGISPVAYAFWQTLIAGALLQTFSLRERCRFQRSVLLYCLISGLTGIAIPNLIAFYLVDKLGAGFTGIMYALPPIFTFLLALALKQETGSVTRFMGLLIAVVACVWVVVHRKAQIESGKPVWYALGFAIPLLLSVGNIFRSMAWPKGIKPMPLASSTLLVTACALGGFGTFCGPGLFSADYSPVALVVIAVQGCLTAVAFFCAFELQQRSDPVFYSQLGAVAAVFGLFIGVLWFNETYPLKVWLGLVVIIFGLRLSNRTVPVLLSRSEIRLSAIDRRGESG